MISIFLMLVWVWASTVVSQLLISGVLVGLVNLLSFFGVKQFNQTALETLGSFLVYALEIVLIIVVPNVLARKRKKCADLATSRTELGLKDWPTWTDIGLAPVGFGAYLFLAAGLVALFNLFPWFDPNQTQNLGFSFFITGFDRVMAFVVLVVMAPIAEEVIFRGWLYGKIREKFSMQVPEVWSVIFSMLLVSVLFGAVHLQWNVGVNVFAMSIILCGLREITGTIYSGIILHMLKNGIAFFLLYVFGMGLGA